MKAEGTAPRTINGDKTVLHHHLQDPNGPIIEIPAGNHSTGNFNQHPFSNTKELGLTPAERAVSDAWREKYWKWRADEELKKRGLEP
jgi:hypothetical protein